MVKVLMFKMPFKTNLFNKKQKVWVQSLTGQMAAKVSGKLRGKYRYISAWVRYDKAEKDSALLPKFLEIDVPKEFAEKHNLLIR